MNSITRIPNPEEPVPAVAWPTVCLLRTGASRCGAGRLRCARRRLADLGVGRCPAASPPTCCSPSPTTPAHHAASSDRAPERPGSAGSRRRSSRPTPRFPVWRFIHMQHHRFTNHHDDGRDPDGYTMRGPSWQRPLRWLTIDLVLHGLLPAQAQVAPARREGRAGRAVAARRLADDRSDRGRVRVSSLLLGSTSCPSASPSSGWPSRSTTCPTTDCTTGPARTSSRRRATGSATSACSHRCCSTRTTTWSTTCTRSSPSIAT